MIANYKINYVFKTKLFINLNLLLFKEIHHVIYENCIQFYNK